MLQNPKHLCSDSHVELPRAPNSILIYHHTSRITGASESCSPNTKAVSRGAWICGRAFSQSGPAQNQQLEESLNRWARVTHPTEECTISKVQNVCLLALCSFLGWRQGQAQQLILCLGRGVPAYLKPLRHTNFTDAKGP